jgi:exosortase A-associated hydrolase 2
MSMTPYYFQSGARRLLGLYHPPETQLARREAVVFCNPFGQEAIRSHRMYRVLADRVARAGFAALRFDYSCTGDSEGDCTAGRLADWVNDVRAADREVRRRNGATRVTWVGLRLGASVALLAADRDASEERRLVLWDPVMSGSAYLEEMARAHVGFLSSVFRWTPNRVARSRGIGALSSMQELVGFEISANLRNEIESLDLGAEREILARQVILLGDQAPETYAPLLTLLAAKAIDSAYVPIEADTPWDSEEALNASTIPARTLDALLAAVENRS